MALLANLAEVLCDHCSEGNRKYAKKSGQERNSDC